MFRPRVIPVLLLRERALVKSVRFRDYKYIGDPINAVRIFNDLKADELIFLDIEASKRGRLIPLDFVRKVGEEAGMPFAVGGGVRSVEDIRAITSAGAERVVIGTRAGENPEFIREASKTFGSSTITVCIDVKMSFFRGHRCKILSGRRPTGFELIEFARLMENSGAGEIMIQSIDRDGTMSGYDIDLISSVSAAVTVPVVALGGAGRFKDLLTAYREGHASALAAGSLFVYQSAQRGVLINYPTRDELVFE